MHPHSLESPELSTPDGTMGAYEVIPSEARGAVVVIQEAFGLNAHIEDVTRRMADAGYHALAPNLFHRAGGGVAPYDDYPQAVTLFAGLDDAAILSDVEAALDHLSTRGWTPAQIGVVGFCMGGRATFLVATHLALGAAVTFYGGGIVTARFPQFPSLIDRAADLRTPWLGLFGDEDASIPVADVERIRQATSAAEVATEVVRYSGAGHGFHCDARPEHFQPAAARNAWDRTLGWFSTHIKG